MKISIKLSFFSLFLLAILSCQNEENPVDSNSLEREELKEFLNGQLVTPNGELARIFTFAGNQDAFQYRQDLYYDEFGKKILTVNLNHESDTLGANIFFYDNLGRLETKKSFEYQNGDFEWTGNLVSTFDSNGTVESIHTLTPDNLTPKFRLRNIYDEEGLLLITEFSDKERYEYSYQGNLPISRQHIIGESVYMEFTYRYNNKEKLEAKETQLNGGGDAFQYFYNAAGKLIEDRENSPQWDYTLVLKKVYEYY